MAGIGSDHTDLEAAIARGITVAREILECFFEGKPIRDEYLIVDGGWPVWARILYSTSK
jgi:hypothetical protein